MTTDYASKEMMCRRLSWANTYHNHTHCETNWGRFLPIPPV